MCFFKFYIYEGVLISKFVFGEYDVEWLFVIVFYYVYLRLFLFCFEMYVVGEKDFFYVLKIKKLKKKKMFLKLLLW